MTCLAGGVGAAKFLQGLINVMPPEDITVVVNTGDDIELHGLHISPDPDIVMYTLADLVDEKGWGIRGDTFNSLGMFQKYGLETWFKLGDKDLATHIYRTHLLKGGFSLDKATHKLCQALGLKVKILPVTNKRIASQIVTDVGKMHFEEYLVKRGARDKVLDVVLEGTDLANPAPGVIESIKSADGIIVCPSNPIVSIGPIQAVQQIRDALREAKARIVAISPIIGGAAIKGPADKLIRGLGMKVSAYSVASLYSDFIDVFIIDEVDRAEKEEIKKLGMKVIATNTIMQSQYDKVELAKSTLKALE
ncbi:MAG: 2-phospho-L-lactate transferase [Candidatus Bathyarchaeota archaeon]|nr:MAG: 2-phospho-L-lactate transferase [Candidatus Bathyarchaeota archaeon]